ncbi:uncharacterized protein EAF01_007849 [Botrytis porri]|uniref:uncharacterized protein n=1 Tax=Botrytis porri TaxID=87229 RepID=UPI00190221C8|nr:uncharacterized protein EAF01_007849 [Botrytis porri]KAF7900547.1 hypothetical protein EAF01_007849 [Botrytis porri]
MTKHSKDQGQTAGKPKQRTKKSERTSHEFTAQPSSNDEQKQEFNNIMQSEARPISQEKIDEGAQVFHADIMTVEERHIEIDIASTPCGWSSDEANSHLEASGKIIQGLVDGLLPASDFDNDPKVFYHLGAQFPIPVHFNTQSAGYTLPQLSWKAPVITTQTIALSTPSSYNASTVAIAYQSTYDFPVTADYSHPTTTTLDTLPVTTQYQLERWVYENDRDEMTPAHRMEEHNYDL